MNFFQCLAVVVLATLMPLEQVNAAVQIGDFAGAPHGITGVVKFTSPTTMVIENFSFDGEPPDTFLYFYGPGIAVNRTGGGTIIPVQGDFTTNEGGFRQSVPITNIELSVELVEVNVCDIGTITLWCRQAQVIFTQVVVPHAAFEQNGEDPCTLRSPRVIVGKLPAGDHRITGTVQFTSPTTVVIDDLSFDGNAPDTFLYTYPPGVEATNNGIGGFLLPIQADFTNDAGGFIENTAINNEDVTIELRNGSICDFGSITLWCRSAGILFSVLLVPMSSYIRGDDGSCMLPMGVEAAQVVAGLLPAGDHSIGGLVRFTSPTTIFIEDFTFDGNAPDTFLYTYARGATVNATGGGTIIRLNGNIASNEGGFIPNQVVPVQDLVIELPNGINVCNIGTLTLWCRQAQVIFSQLPISESLFTLNGDNCLLNNGVIVAGHWFPPTVHDITGEVHITSTTSLLIKNFNFDGQPPDTFVYAYGPGDTVNPTGNGSIIPIERSLANDEGGFQQFQTFVNTDLAIELNGINICDIGTLTLWCRSAMEIFVQLEISRNLFVNGGADPCTLGLAASEVQSEDEFDNCIPLGDSLQLSWKVDRPNNVINFMLCGCLGVDINVPQYMGFGASGNDQFTWMDEADVVIAWVNSSRGAHAVDYHLSGRFQCRSGNGVCPDELFSSGNCSNDVTNIEGRVINRQQCVSYTRSFNTNDSTCDLPLNPDNTQQYIVWGIGGLGETAFKHFSRAETSDPPIHFGREPLDECAEREIVCTSCDTFEAQQIVALKDTTFSAQIGPSGSERGYMGITGRPGWGIAWYINGVLIPELVLQRGRTYTFIVEGGSDSTDPGNYHPFYITDSIEGGKLTSTNRATETVYAGFDADDNPTGVGRLCQLRETAEARNIREGCGTLTDYLDQLSEPQCTEEQPAIIIWTPDENTPDIVYYQCATHLNLGFRIMINGAPPVASLLTLLLLLSLFMTLII